VGLGGKRFNGLTNSETVRVGFVYTFKSNKNFALMEI
jgi:hypothetical protein